MKDYLRELGSREGNPYKRIENKLSSKVEKEVEIKAAEIPKEYTEPLRYT